MEKGDNKKLMMHIDGAKDWLEKAKGQYSQENPIGGDLTLNLAQAELKYAWELSHSGYVVNQKRGARRFEFKILLPIAASIVVVLSSIAFWFQTDFFKMVPGVTPVVTRSIVAAPFSKVTKTNHSNQNIAFTAQKTIAVPTKSMEHLTSIKEPSVSKTETVVSSNPSESDRLTKTENIGANQVRVKESLASQPGLQPVSQLSIDEDALTKEASHSLQHGK